MTSTSYDTKRPYPFHRSASYNIPRSKTPNTSPEHAFDKVRTTEQLRRARTPLPHEEDGRHRRRTTSTSAKYADRPSAHARTKSYSNLRGDEPKRNDPCFNLHAKKEEGAAWDGLAYDVDFQVRMWIMQEETRRLAAAREAERTRLVQEEVRRVQMKLLMKREQERLRMWEEMRLAREEQEHERARRHKTAADRVVANAWAIYERNWAAISSSSEPLSFGLIPWPTLSRPLGPSSITLLAVSAFLLSDAHSSSQKPKERIKEALRRWHPDRFVRFLRRVPEGERSTVEEAVGVVARCLNELLSKCSE